MIASMIQSIHAAATTPRLGPLGPLAARTYYEVSRLRMLDQWWHWLLLALVVISLIAFVATLYRRDGIELPRSVRWLLFLLRMTAFAGLLIFFLNIEKRTEQKLVKSSRAVLLVDTSQSMGLSDPATNGTRMDAVKGLLGEEVVEELRKSHDVAVYTFDQQDRPAELALLARTTAVSSDDAPVDAATRASAAINEVRTFYIAGAVLLGLAVLAVLAHLAFGQRVRTGEGESWALLIGIISLIVAGVCFSVSHLRQPQVGWRQIFQGEALELKDNEDQEDGENDADADPQLANADWRTQLTPQGLETRLGDAVQFLIDKERGGPIAGITVFTDGNGNAGSEYTEALAAAQEAEISVNFVGIGTSERPANVRLVDVEAPQRVYPGDEFRIKAFVQAYGLDGSSAKVELGSTEDKPGDKPPTPNFEEERIVTLAADGEVVAVEFNVTPEELGRRIYTLKVSTGGRDLDPDDNQQTARVQVVDRKNRILMLAGGPTREYRFARNLFFRDKNTTLDVHLQSAPKGAAQEANKVLEEFPATAEELFEYDCIVAFDPDWEALDPAQIELLDRWVAEKSGGLVLVAGPVYMPEWTTLRRDTPMTQTLKALYPVTFFSRTVARLARGEIAETPNALSFTDSGRQSRFLWLDDDLTRSEASWAGFEGIYQTFPIRSVKPGATVLVNIDKDDTGSDTKPVFIAEQFYGSGRILYLGTGELWRLRTESVAQFEQLYTKMIRHVSQGRLLRDSTRGVLMLAKDRCLLGETVVVRASLTDAQFRPLTEESVKGDLVQPDGVRIPIELRAVKDATRAGNYSGQFTAIREGDYRVELPVPNSDDLELLVRELKVRVPQLEVENPQRNDAVMNEIATATGGKYFTDLAQVTDLTNPDGFIATVVPQDQETYLPGTPDQSFQQRLMGWLMALICGVLCLEWLFRRLSKLA